MRVLFLSMWYPNPQNPVSGTFVHEQAQALRERGVDVRVMQPLPLTPFPVTLVKRSYRELAAIADTEQYAGHPVYHPRYLTLPAHLMFDRVGEWMYRAIRERIAALHREWPFDVLHAHATYPCGYAANRCRDELFPSVKVMHTIHRTCIIDAPHYSRACFDRVRTALDGADFNVFVSKEGMKLGLEYTNQSIAGRSAYITNGVNVDRFSLSPADVEVVHALKERHADTWNLVFVGYLKEVKGIKELLQAVKGLVAQGRSRLRLFLVGDNQLGSYVQDFLSEHGLGEIVILVGAVQHQQVKVWMRFADAFILPSHSEGTPTVLFEALFMGAPSIFTQVGGVGDVVSDRQEALLIPPRSVSAIETAIGTLMDDGELCQAMGARGQALIASQYTWTLNAKAIVDVYQDMFGVATEGTPIAEPA